MRRPEEEGVAGLRWLASEGPLPPPLHAMTRRITTGRSRETKGRSTSLNPEAGPTRKIGLE